MPQKNVRSVSSPLQASAPHHAELPTDKVAKRAYEKWCRRGKPNGTAERDWLEAEAELLAELGRNGSHANTAPRNARTSS